MRTNIGWNCTNELNCYWRDYRVYFTHQNYMYCIGMGKLHQRGTIEVLIQITTMNEHQYNVASGGCTQLSAYKPHDSRQIPMKNNESLELSRLPLQARERERPKLSVHWERSSTTKWHINRSIPYARPLEASPLAVINCINWIKSRMRARLSKSTHSSLCTV